jgi:hypothetical protein
VVIDGAATLADPDSPNFDTGTLTVSFTAGGTADDRLAIRNEGNGAGQIGVSGSTVSFGGTAIGAFSGGTSGSTPLVVTLNANANAAATQALLRNITFANVAGSPAIAPRTVQFALTDGDGGNSNLPTESIQIATLNDNAGPGFSASAGWFSFGGQGFAGTVHYAAGTSLGHNANWTFTVSPGLYRLAATWFPHANRATNAPFALYDGVSSQVLAASVNQELEPDDFSAGGSMWEYLGGPVSITSSTALVKLTDFANEYVIADAVALVRIGDSPGGVEIQVLESLIDVPDNSGSVNFGATSLGTPVSKTFRVKNVGAGSLTVQPVSVPSGFTVTSNIPADTMLASGAEVTFTVRLDATSAGAPSGLLSFVNSDADENPFNFTISGTVTFLQIVDDGTNGFSVTPGWTAYAGLGRDGDLLYTDPGDGSRIATWTFPAAPGQYRVAATWSDHANRATNAPFSVLDGSMLLTTVLVNQQLPPAGLPPDAGSNWFPLGGTLLVTGNSVVVRVTNAANGFVIADAVRLERLGDLPSAPEIQVLEGATNIAHGAGSVDFGSTFLGVPRDKTFRVRNQGAANLTIGAISALPPNFSVVSDIPAGTLPPGGEVTFTIRFLGTASSSGSISFSNNDADESPFSFTISGTVAPVRIFDNGDNVFSTVGNWEPFDGQGFQNDVHFSAAGTGADVASWTIPVSPGQYRVSVTWSTHANRATDARFTVLNGGTELATININQELPPAGALPDGVTDAGFNWQFLGGIHNITGSTLVIRLTDLANEYVIADAVRIERIGNLPEAEGAGSESSLIAAFISQPTEKVSFETPIEEEASLAVLRGPAERIDPPSSSAGRSYGMLTEMEEEAIVYDNSDDFLGPLAEASLMPQLVEAAFASDDWV